MTGTARAASRPQTLRFQRLANLITRAMIATPGVSRGIGRVLLTLYVTGRTTGRRYAVPVAYTRHEGRLLVGTSFGWARNLRTGERASVMLKGRKVSCDVTVCTSEQDVTRLYRVICRGNKNFARFNTIACDAAGEPDAGDLHAAWAGGARAILLAPRS